jgi:hypothetical protein
MEQTARDLDIDAGKHVEGLKRAFDVAAPAPIPWAYACAQYAAGRWHLLANDGAAALIAHTGVAGHMSTSIVAMAGVLGECDPLVAWIEAKARAAGSSMVVYIGRRGWSKAFPGYKERAVIGVKEL